MVIGYLKKMSLHWKLCVLGVLLFFLFALASVIESIIYPCGWCNSMLVNEWGGYSCTLMYCPPYSSPLLHLSLIAFSAALAVFIVGIVMRRWWGAGHQA